MKNTYEDLTNRTHKYSTAGVQKNIAISNTLSSLNIVKTTTNPINTMITKVNHLGSKITNLEDNCFYGCSHMTDIELGNVKHIGKSCFQGTTNLETAIRATNVILSLDDKAFYNSGITTLNLKLSGLTYLESDDFEDCKFTYKETGPYVGLSAFAECHSLRSVNLMMSTEIGSHMFAKCNQLSSVTFANHGSCVGEYAFWGCTALSSITLPYNFQTLSYKMFADCTHLSSITFQDSSSNPSHLMDIGDYCFQGCTNLKSLTFPQSLSSFDMINGNDLAGSSITTIKFKGLNSTAIDKYVDKEITASAGLNIINTIPTDRKYKYGVWYGGSETVINDVIKFAKEKGYPLFLLETMEEGCGLCTAFKNHVLRKANWNTWMVNKPILFCMGSAGGTKIADVVEQVRQDWENRSLGGSRGTLKRYTSNGEKYSGQTNSSGFAEGAKTYGGVPDNTLYSTFPVVEFLWFNENATSNIDVVKMKSTLYQSDYCYYEFATKTYANLTSKINEIMNNVDMTYTPDQSMFTVSQESATAITTYFGNIGRNFTIISSDNKSYTWNNTTKKITAAS